MKNEAPKKRLSSQKKREKKDIKEGELVLKELSPTEEEAVPEKG